MVPDSPERVSVVVAGEVLYVLKEEHLGTVVLGDLVDLEEKGSARIFEPFLFPGDAESLAGKSAAHQAACGPEIAS